MSDFTADEIASGNERLLRLARILDVADEGHQAKGEPAYNQRQWRHVCGTPACAFGHAVTHMHDFPYRQRGSPSMLWMHGLARSFFVLSQYEAIELFSQTGCGEAKSAKDAAKYIYDFVQRRSPSPICDPPDVTAPIVITETGCVA